VAGILRGFFAQGKVAILGLFLVCLTLADCECKKPTGFIPYLTYFGTHGSGDKDFDRPMGIDKQKLTLMVADFGNNRIVRYYSVQRSFEIKWGSPGAGNGEFNGPTDVAMLLEGIDPKFVYVVDSGNNRIQKFDGAGKFITKWGTFGDGDGEFDRPISVAVDDEGYVYVTDFGNNRIQKFDGDGNFVLKWGSKGTGAGELDGPYGIATEGDEHYNPKYIYVTDQGNHRVQIFTKTGGLVRAFGGYGSGNGQLRYPCGIAAEDGRSHIADTGNARYVIFDVRGRYLGKGGGRELMKPVGITIDGTLFISDEGQHRIVIFDWKY
jgi:tripartite motif-containing protein 71